jgi:hypothetical protein
MAQRPNEALTGGPTREDPGAWADVLGLTKWLGLNKKSSEKRYLRCSLTATLRKHYKLRRRASCCCPSERGAVRVEMEIPPKAGNRKATRIEIFWRTQVGLMRSVPNASDGAWDNAKQFFPTVKTPKPRELSDTTQIKRQPLELTNLRTIRPRRPVKSTCEGLRVDVRHGRGTALKSRT